MVSPPYAAELRVYEPLSAFPPEERRTWQAYLAAGPTPSTREGQRLERAVGLAAACRPAARVPRPGELGPHAYLVVADGMPLICPWRTELRCWRGATELGALLPTEVVPSVLPEAEQEVAAQEHERWLTEHPQLRAHILTTRWVVPVRWFLLVHPDERRLRLGPPAAAGEAGTAGGSAAAGPGAAAGATATAGPGAGAAGSALPATEVGRSLLYRTAMADARRRIARSLAVLRRAFDTGPVVGTVESLGRWLEEFHPRSVVELDYGGLVDLRSDAELRADDSAGDLVAALAALSDGDIQIATEAYDRVIERWRIAHRVESAN
jgi:hypothetical protein